MSDEQMAPEASPGGLSKKSGVRRVNNRPIYILACVLGVFLLMMIIVAMDRAAKQHAPAEDAADNHGNSAIFAREITGDHNDGIIQPAVPPSIPKPPPPKALAIARADDLDTPPQPPRLAALPEIPAPQRDEDARRIERARRHMLEEAIKARTGVQAVAPRSGAAAPIPNRPQTREQMLAEIARVRRQIAANRSGDPTAAYQARLAQLQGMGVGGATGNRQSNDNAPLLMRNQAAANGGNDGYARFDNEGDRWRLDTEVEAPRSPYQLRAGFVVPATLISGINSDLPGQIIAQVSQHVYDSATGKHLLIPQGARLVGAYSSDVIYGQARVLVAWQRIVFPDGKALDIGAMPGADGAGYSGFHDRVNNHYFRIFASAFLMSGITAGISLSQEDSRDNGRLERKRASEAFSEALGQQLGQVTVEMIRKNLNIAPTLEIRPGYRFNVIVTKDMTFSKPYRAFDY